MIEKPAAHTDLTCHLRRLREAVKGTACALEGRWRWLAAPMALVVWVLTRRERREAAETMRAMQGMLEAFLAIFEDFRAGRLPASAPPEVVEEREEDGLAPALPGVADCPARCADGAAAAPQYFARDSNEAEAAEPLACEPIVEVESLNSTANPAEPNVEFPWTDLGAGLPVAIDSAIAGKRESLRLSLDPFGGQAGAPPAAIFKNDVDVAAGYCVDFITISK